MSSISHCSLVFALWKGGLEAALSAWWQNEQIRSQQLIVCYQLLIGISCHIASYFTSTCMRLSDGVCAFLWWFSVYWDEAWRWSFAMSCPITWNSCVMLVCLRSYNLSFLSALGHGASETMWRSVVILSFPLLILMFLAVRSFLHDFHSTGCFPAASCGRCWW